MLALIATVSRYKKGELICQEGARADHIFNIISGVVKSSRSQPNRKQQVMGFLFPHDLFGLAELGKYVNSASAVNQVILYKIPTAALEARLRRNPSLDFQVICRLCHDLREAQQIQVPMARTDIGAYVNMSPEAVTRSLRALVRRGVISVRDRHHIKIIDRAGLEEVIAEAPPAPTRRRHAALLHS